MIVLVIVMMMIIVQFLALWVIARKTVFGIIFIYFFLKPVKKKAKSNKKMCHMRGLREEMCLVKYSGKSAEVHLQGDL